MSYGIIRVQKFTAGSVKGIELHDHRKRENINPNKDINLKLTKGNYDLCSKKNKNFTQAIKERISQLNLKKAIRKDAIVMAQVLVTSDSNFFNQFVDKKEQKQFFRKCFNFLSGRYGKENVISSIVHVDEKTPHMHFNFVPVTEDGRLSAKSILTRQSLIQQQTDFYEVIGKEYNLQRGVQGSNHKHIEITKLKLQTEEEKLIEITKSIEKSLEEKKKLDTMLENASEMLENRLKDVKATTYTLKRTVAKIGEIRLDFNSTEEKRIALQNEITNLENKVTTLSSEELEEIHGFQGLFGSLKGVSYQEYERLVILLKNTLKKEKEYQQEISRLKNEIINKEIQIERLSQKFCVNRKHPSDKS